jgi:hypothetical protein
MTWLPWTTDYQPSSLLGISHASMGIFEHSWTSWGSYMATTAVCCQSTSLVPKALSQTWLFQLVLDFLQSQHSRWSCSHFYPGQMGSTSPSGPAEGMWLVQTLSFMQMWTPLPLPFSGYMSRLFHSMLCASQETPFCIVLWCYNIRPNDTFLLRGLLDCFFFFGLLLIVSRVGWASSTMRGHQKWQQSYSNSKGGGTGSGRGSSSHHHGSSNSGSSRQEVSWRVPESSHGKNNGKQKWWTQWGLWHT